MRVIKSTIPSSPYCTLLINPRYNSIISIQPISSPTSMVPVPTDVSCLLHDHCALASRPKSPLSPPQSAACGVTGSCPGLRKVSGDRTALTGDLVDAESAIVGRRWYVGVCGLLNVFKRCLTVDILLKVQEDFRCGSPGS